jgi:peptidoglycan hydrolase-like protein with peptidoglycan-binding domain
MKQFIIAALMVLALPGVASAQGFSQDVSYGMTGTSVLEVQEFLGAHGYFFGPYTGNFYSLTLAAVKRFQAAHSIPTTGYFGPLSRGAANVILATEAVNDEETPTTPNPIVNPPQEEDDEPAQGSVDEPAAGDDNEPMPDPTPEGEVEISINDTVSSVYATGFGNQILGSITVENNTSRTITLGGSLSDIKSQLNTSIVDGVGDDTLSFLFLGDKKSQVNLQSKNANIEPGDEATVQIRLKNQPGETGTFTLKVGTDERQIEVVAND